MGAASTPSERLRDAVLGVALLGFAVALWFHFIPRHAGGHGEHTILAQIAAILIGGLSCLLLLLCLFGIPTESRSAIADDPFLETQGGGESPILLVLALIWGVFVLGLEFVGFYPGGALALCASFVALGLRSPVRILCWSGGAVLVSYLAFELGFRLSLPQGTVFRMLLDGG